MRIVYAYFDQNRTIHNAVFIGDKTREDLIDIDADFANSPAIASIFANKDIRTIILIVYLPLGSTTKLRRRIGGSRKLLEEADIKVELSRIAADLKLDLSFHSKSDFKKILPMNSEDREQIKKILENP